MTLWLWRQWPLTTVLLGVVVALTFVALDRFRVGAVLLAASVVGALILRIVLTDRQAGLLAVRTRGVDIGVLGVLAGMLTILALWVPPPQ
ncbi:MAG: DUF3017 domain-containing protein [Actinobacteria bacterium]|nr:DUF3017 domain-containing protein [Actinomycetota bacterium]